MCWTWFCATVRNKLYHWTKQRASPQTCVSFSPWHTDVIASTCPPAGMPASAATCPGGCKEFSHKGSKAPSIWLTCKICGTVRKEERHPQRQDPATCSHRHTDHRGEQRTHAKDTYCADCGTYIDLVPREIFNALEATRSRIVMKSLRIVC